MLCLLFEDDQRRARVVLTRRSRHLPTHAGEVAFPGGRLLPGEGPLEAALREAREEVSLDVSTVEVVAELTALTTRLSIALAHCFVAIFPGPAKGGTAGPQGSSLAASDGEVEEIFCPALSDLLDEGVFAEELWPVAGGATLRAVPFFRLPAYGDAVVWGATGRMLFELLERVTHFVSLP